MARWDRGALCAKIGIERANSTREFIYSPGKSYAGRAKYHIVEVLPMLGFHVHAGIHIAIDEEVIKNKNVWECARPNAVLKARRA